MGVCLLRLECSGTSVQSMHCILVDGCRDICAENWSVMWSKVQ
jgi:hypothetical protein